PIRVCCLNQVHSHVTSCGETTMRKISKISPRVGIVAAALITTPFLGSPALGAVACVTGSVASYVALDGTGCSVDGFTFTNISVSTTTSGGGSVVLGNFT